MALNPLKFVKDTDWQHQTNNEILTHLGIELKLSNWDTYEFQGRNVPRVSEILKRCIGKDYLVTWAARLGLEEYRKESNRTLYIGSIVHEVIEGFLLHKEINIPDNIHSGMIRSKISRAVNNFVNWYEYMIQNGYTITVIAIEKQITCPWYGGTIDCIMTITNNNTGISKTYIVDFKTSKQISIEYLLQTYAYLWAIKWNKTYYDSSLPDIDGIGIIRIDKEAVKFQDLFLDFENNNMILKDIEYSLTSMVNWYYHSYAMEYNLKISKNINKERNI